MTSTPGTTPGSRCTRCGRTCGRRSTPRRSTLAAPAGGSSISARRTDSQRRAVMAEDPVQSLAYGPNPALSAQAGVEAAVAGPHRPDDPEPTPTQAVPTSDHGTADDADQGRAPAAAGPEPEAEEAPAAKPPAAAKPAAPRGHRSAGGRAGGRA